MKAALKRKELEEIKEENQRLKNKNNESTEPKESITKDEHAEITEVPEIKIYKNYLPLCVTVALIGLGFYFMKPKQKKTVPAKKEKEIDPFEF